MVVLAAGVRVEIVSNDILATALGLLWLIGMTNAFNLLDNMDGLAATLAAIACLFFAIDAFTVHPNNTVAVLSLGICFACLGFLPYNLRLNRPAAVFMGDSGSQVLGFALASLGLAASWTVAGSTVATLLLPILVLAVPILDTTLVTIVRILEGRPVTRGGRDHTSHRLVYQGLSDKRAVVLLCVVSAALGLTSLAYKVLDDTLVTLDRRADHVRVPAPVRQLPRRREPCADLGPRAVVRPLAARPPAPPRRGDRRLRADLRFVHRRRI